MGRHAGSRTSSFVRAVAFDFDGTLTDAHRPSPDVLSAIAEARARRIAVLLVTGRIMRDLLVEFPDVGEHVDQVVAENGAVLWTPRGSRLLATPVDPAVAAHLLDRGIRVRCGEAIVAGSATDDAEVLRAIHALGLDCQVVYNRSALMIVPAGVSKGSGLYFALGELGISHHNAVAVGDAENDHSLLDVGEVSVAVANAVPALKRHADVVLDEPDGAGCAAFLRGPLVGGTARVHSPRYQVTLGRDVHGAAVAVPASQFNLLVAGAVGAGKSYVAGGFAERLVALGYSVLVVDPEGDHLGLARLRGLMTMTPGPGAGSADRVVEILQHRFGSAVVDLSEVPLDERADRVTEIRAAAERLRAEVGLPHWIVLEEAHALLEADELDRTPLDAGLGGYCFVSYRPWAVPAPALRAVDAAIVLPGGHDANVTARAVAVAIGEDPALVETLLAAATPGSALLVARREIGGTRLFAIADRTTRQLRHWRTVIGQCLPEHERFYFRPDGGSPVAAAGNLTEFVDTVAGVDAAVLVEHARNGDFSRWIDGVIRDPGLASAVAEVEGSTILGPIDVDDLRERLASVVAARCVP